MIAVVVAAVVAVSAVVMVVVALSGISRFSPADCMTKRLRQGLVRGGLQT